MFYRRSIRLTTLLVGVFWLFGVSANAQLFLPGQPDTSFNYGLPNAFLTNAINPQPGEGPNRAVRTLAMQSSGKALIGGEFSLFNGLARNRIARLNADGSVDTSFNSQGTGFSGDVTGIAVQPDDKLIVTGFFSSYNGISRPRIARLHPNGQLDTTFNPGTGFGFGVETVSVLADGKILVAGSFNSYNGVTRNRIARLHPNGSLDTTFNPGMGANQVIRGLAVQPDGKVVIAGDFTSYGGVTRMRVARIDANGSIDTTFDPGLGSTQPVHVIRLTPDGKMYIGGFFQSFAGRPFRSLVRLHPNGSVDSTTVQAMGLNGTTRHITLLPDGNLLVSGSFTEVNGRPRLLVAKLFPNGSLDTTYNHGTGTFSEVVGHVLQADGKLVIAGGFSSIQGYTRIAVTRLNANGSLDVNYNPIVGIRGSVWQMSLMADGRFYVVGNITQHGDIARNYIARLHADGRLDTSFNPGSGTDYFISSIAAQPDGKIVIGGSFTSYNGISRNNIARINPDGSLDTTFNPGSGTNSFIAKVLIQPDGKLLIQGHFGVVNGVIREYLARLHANGSLDTTFVPRTFSAGWSTSVWMHDMALQPDGKLLVGGVFSSYNGILRQNLLRLNADGSLDTTFISNPGAGARVRTIALLPDGKLYVGGEFVSYGTALRNRIARVNANGSIDLTFNPTGGFNDVVSKITVQSDSLLLVGGSFSTANGVARGRFARMFPNGQLDTTYNIGSGFNEFIGDIVIQPDGKALVSGWFSAIDGYFSPRIARLLGGNCAGQVTNTTSAAPICASNSKSLTGTAGGRWVITSGSGSIVGNTYFPSAAGGTVTIINLIGSCASPAITFQVNPMPQPPFVLPIPAVCSGNTATISPLAGGASYLFWSDSVGGAPLNGPVGTTSFTTSALSANTTYYVSSLSAAGCESSVRRAVTVAVLPNPTVTIGQLNDTLWANTNIGSFQWFKDSVAIAGANAAFFVPTQPGNYWLKLTNAEGCSANSNAINVVITNLSIHESTKHINWSAYPVPFEHQLQLAADAPFVYQLLDLRGAVLLEGESKSNEITLPTTHLASGVYLVRIKVNGQTAFRRVVKQ